MFLQGNQVTGAVGESFDAVGSALKGITSSVSSALPGVISAFIILFVGYIVAKIIKGALGKILRTVKFNDLADKVGINGIMAKGGLKSDASGLVASMVYWMVMLTVLILFFNKLGLPAVSGLMSDIVAFIPKIIVGCILLMVGMYGANFASDMATTTLKAGGSAQHAGLVGKIVYGAIMFLVVSMVLDQIGIGGDIVNTLVTSLLGGLSIAAAIAFGLGGKDWAARMINKLG